MLPPSTGLPVVMRPILTGNVSLGPFDGRCSLRTWIYRIAHNVGSPHDLRAGGPGNPRSSPVEGEAEVDRRFSGPPSISSSIGMGTLRSSQTSNCRPFFTLRSGRSSGRKRRISGWKLVGRRSLGRSLIYKRSRKWAGWVVAKYRVCTSCTNQTYVFSKC